MDSKQRKIRSLRGFFLYALEILENGKDYQILETNLQPFFWRKVKNIIRQNKKSALLEFLFGSDNDRGDSFQSLRPSLKEMEKKIKNLLNQVNYLEARICDLEITRDNSKYPLSNPSHPSESLKTIQQDDSTIDSNRALIRHKIILQFIQRLKNPF